MICGSDRGRAAGPRGGIAETETALEIEMDEEVRQARKVIGKEQQQELFKEFKTPEHVQQHCNEVARVAVLIGKKLNEHGYHLDIDEIRGAALVHDLVRVQPDHDLRCAEILETKGYPEEAGLVRHHMKYYPFNDAAHVDEQDILCLADRVVKENHYVGLDERMDYLIHKPGVTPDKVEKILKSKEHTGQFIESLEKIMGITLDQLCSEKNN